MKQLILSWLLHHANRHTKSESFYKIKDEILTRYGKQVGYDIQHIPGKTCNSCGGRGQHPKYSNTPPYKIYDWADCYHCWGGWYKFPKWICLARIEFGTYIFHKPLKREEKINNPFTKEELGWDVTMFWTLWEQFKQELRYKWRWRKRRIMEVFTWRGMVLTKPQPFIKHWIDANGNANEDLPF
jgi:hypothetical protein